MQNIFNFVTRWINIVFLFNITFINLPAMRSWLSVSLNFFPTKIRDLIDNCVTKGIPKQSIKCSEWIFFFSGRSSLYPPHRGYISSNSKTFEICLSVRPSVRPSVVNTIASDRKELQTWKFTHGLLLPIRWLVLKMGYIGLQDLVPPI